MSVEWLFFALYLAALGFTGTLVWLHQHEPGVTPHAPQITKDKHS